MTSPILVTGAGGNVGAEIVKLLIAADLPVRAADLDAAALRQRFGPAIEAVTFDFGDPGTYPAALQGVEALFLMRPPKITAVRRLMFPFIDTAKAAGARRVAFLSLIGIENTPRVPHYPVEQYLIASGLEYTFLRSSYFMQNLNTTHRAEIRDRNEIFVPVGLGKTSFIDVRDIAAVAVKALSESGHSRQAYELTGGEALDYEQVAALFSEILGHKITYADPSPLRFVWFHLQRGLPLPYTLVMAGLYTATRRGMAEQVTGEVLRLLGRPPISLRQYIQDYRDYWSA